MTYPTFANSRPLALHRLRDIVAACLLGGLLLLTACGSGESETGTGSAQPTASASSPTGSATTPTANPAAPQVAKHDTGPDLDSIKSRGELRIIVPASLAGNRYLPRKGSPIADQQIGAEQFARSQGLTPRLIPVSAFKDIIPMLENGAADLAAANLTITDARKKRIGFSVPITHVKEVILVAATTDGISRLRDLKGKRVMADPSTAFWKRLNKLATKHGFTLVKRPAGLGDEEELDLIANGTADACVRDSNIAEMYLGYRTDLKQAFELKGSRDIAWGTPKDAPKLRAELNRFLHLEQFTDQQDGLSTADLDAIKKRKTLRVLLRNNAASYFLYRGDLLGFEYEMVREFAKQNRMRVEIIVPPTHSAMLDWLKAGRADLAAGFLEPTERRRKAGIDFTRPYHYGHTHLVARQNDPISTLEQLNGRNISVRRSSAYWDQLKQLQASGIAFTLTEAPDDSETEQLIQQVAEGEIDLTLADTHILNIELAVGTAVKSALTIGDERAHSVAIRPNNPKLKAALNRYIKKSYKGVVYNILYKKYFKNERRIRKLAAQRERQAEKGHLSPYQQLTKRYADRYNFDWRLITAQMYQESRFDPKAVSFAGAKGLLQVMPRTAQSMGFKNLHDPEIGIHAGVKYLDWVRDRFEPELTFADRTWFTLAAYNAGYGHVADARRLAAKKGWDPNRWIDHTERAMLLLSQKKYAKKARYGYVRGREPVNYVREIKQRFEAYVIEVETATGDREDTPPELALLHSLVGVAENQPPADRTSNNDRGW